MPAEADSRALHSHPRLDFSRASVGFNPGPKGAGGSSLAHLAAPAGFRPDPVAQGICPDRAPRPRGLTRRRDLARYESVSQPPSRATKWERGDVPPVPDAASSRASSRMRRCSWIRARTCTSWKTSYARRSCAVRTGAIFGRMISRRRYHGRGISALGGREARRLDMRVMPATSSLTPGRPPRARPDDAEIEALLDHHQAEHRRSRARAGSPVGRGLALGPEEWPRPRQYRM